MVAPISVPSNQPNPSSVAVPNNGRRGSQSLFSPFSPPGGTSIAAAAALGTSPPNPTNMSMSSSGTTPGFGSGFLGSGLGRSISNGKQIGQPALMSPTAGTVDTRGQGILRRLSLSAGAARPNFKSPAVTSPANMPPAADNSIDHSQTDITSSTSYFNNMSSPPANSSSAITASGAAKPAGAAPSFYANPFSGAVLHEHHDEHDSDHGMSALTINVRGNNGDAQSPNSGASAGASGWARDNPGTTQEQARPRKVSFGWSGFMGGRPAVERPAAPASPPVRNGTADPIASAPPSILVRREDGPASPPSGVTRIPQEDKYKFTNGGQGEPPVSVTVHQVSLASPIPTPRDDSTLTRATPAETRRSPPAAPVKPSGTGLLGGRGRRGSEAGAGGKKRSVSPMAEHILRGGPGQF